MTDQTPYWMGLSRSPGIGPARMRLLLDYFGSAEGAWGATYADLLAAGLDSRTADALVTTRRNMDLDAEIDHLERAGARALTWDSEDYPERLRELEDAPPVLYTLGELTSADAWSVAVVGTRRATAYGREVTARLVAGLAEAGITVVSGLPLAIPLIHSGTLSTGASNA